VQIEGAARVLFLEFPIHTTVDAVYHDGSTAIDSVAGVAGNLDIHAVVRVHGEGAYTRVDYQASMVPDFWLPPLIGDYLIGRQVRRQFEGMVAEMHRRADGHQTRGADGLRLGGIGPGRAN
jgi:carbon monoxide dehydrogenase subunit G